MKNKLFISVLLFSLQLIAQENVRFINSFKLYSGFNNVSDPKGIDLYKIDPSVEKFDFNRYVKNGYTNSYKTDEWDWWPALNYYINASIEHKLLNNKISWFCGLNYVSTKRQYSYFHEEHINEFSRDYENNVLVYSQDSVQILRRNENVELDVFSIENSFSFSTNQNKRFSVYGGVSLQLGLAVTNVNYNLENSLYTEEIFHDSLLFNSTSNSYYSASNTNYIKADLYSQTNKSTNFYFSANAYFGTNLMLTGINRETNRLYLFSEFKPGYAFMYVNPSKSFVSFYNGFFSLVGLRYKI